MFEVAVLVLEHGWTTTMSWSGKPSVSLMFGVVVISGYYWTRGVSAEHVQVSLAYLSAHSYFPWLGVRQASVSTRPRLVAQQNKQILQRVCTLYTHRFNPRAFFK